jgi:AraC-like DNA-binding protein
MSGQTWSDISTESVPAARRLDFLCDSFLKLMSPIRASDVKGSNLRVRRRGFDSGNGTSFWCAGATFGSMLRLERTSERCRRDGVDSLYVALPISAIGPRAHDGGTGVIQPGQALVHDVARPFRSVTLGFSYYGLLLDRHYVTRALGPHAERLAGQAVTLDAGSSALLHGLCAGMTAGGPDLSPAMLGLSLDLMGNAVLEALMRVQVDASELRRSDRDIVAVAKRLIVERLHDPTLGVHGIAQALGTSRSALYAAFKGEAQGIAAFLSAVRLDRARDLLALNDGRTVCAVAFTCGFDCLWTFNRLFRQRFGFTPSRARSGDARA